jgi:hypothetical protein
MALLPEIRGTLKITSEPEPFFKAFRRRVQYGLLTGKPHSRSKYMATLVDANHLTVRAADWKSAINVGLNDMEFEWVGKGKLNYRVRYWRWTLYCVALGAVLAAIGIALVLTFDVRSYLTAAPGRLMWGLSVEQNIMLLWAFIVFWGFVWPWILVALHKRPLHSLVNRLVTAVDESIAALNEN